MLLQAPSHPDVDKSSHPAKRLPSLPAMGWTPANRFRITRKLRHIGSPTLGGDGSRYQLQVPLVADCHCQVRRAQGLVETSNLQPPSPASPRKDVDATGVCEGCAGPA